MTLPLHGALLTDYYQLTMLQGYYAQRMEEQAVFEFFVRALPAERNFLLACGLEDLLDFLERFHFTAEELRWLAEHGGFSNDFLDYLAGLRFTGEVHAMAEGTVCFANEPLVRVTAPLPQAQIIESRLINILHYQTLIASKAVRCALAAPGKLLVDFGLRRAHGAEAGLYAARASYLAGFAGSATTLAGARLGIPVFGTMAHSFVQCHDSEKQAFRDFARAQPDNVVLLIDTYDTEAAARKVVAIAPALRQQGIAIRAVRLDSGDLAAHAHQVRAILDDGGLHDTGIFCSGNLDETAIASLLARGAPIDGFGVGTLLDTSADAPYLDCAYKLQEYAGRARRKRSEGKATWPGRKQVYRHFDGGTMCRDSVALASTPADGIPLLHHCMHEGRRIVPRGTLEAAREHVDRQLAALPAAALSLARGYRHPVEIAPELQALARRVDEESAHLASLES